MLSRALLLSLCLAVPSIAFAQEKSPMLQKYVIERDLPGAGKLTPAELQGISRKSRDVLEKMGPRIQWVQSYVTADKIYCVYMAENEESIRKHAQAGGFPANRVSRVSTMIDLTTAN
jgi:hypothetical protein